MLSLMLYKSLMLRPPSKVFIIPISQMSCPTHQSIMFHIIISFISLLKLLKIISKKGGKEGVWKVNGNFIAGNNYYIESTKDYQKHACIPSTL